MSELDGFRFTSIELSGPKGFGAPAIVGAVKDIRGRHVGNFVGAGGGDWVAWFDALQKKVGMGQVWNLCEVKNWRIVHEDEPWRDVFERIPACYFKRVGEKILVPPWLWKVIEAWKPESFRTIDPEKLVGAVKRFGKENASNLLVKLAAQFDAGKLDT